MAGAEVYSVGKWVVPANQVLNIPAVGSFLACLSSSLDDFLIGIDGDAPAYLASGLTVVTRDGETFSLFVIDNSKNASQLTVRLAWGTGSLRDSRLSLTGSVTVSKASVLNTIADVTVLTTASTEILAANAVRREALISNLDAAQDVRIGDASVAVAQGVVLRAGQSMVLETTEAIFAHNPGAGSVLFGITWTED